MGPSLGYAATCKEVLQTPLSPSRLSVTPTPPHPMAGFLRRDGRDETFCSGSALRGGFVFVSTSRETARARTGTGGLEDEDVEMSYLIMSSC
ncbi:uncharacterized protein H6S33_010346 [Morchella sextelata]|uniref:uncharacterized protein n=1 Tax=Morchella sextelata TaxID=1174677 RepID=UPI001D0570CD|nr:uncharacterized protein H6S33_010346 [Morchella sextelata]KAH0612294.1 hypothetical protein H6S33_010346 [Morchella sextelata]